MKILRPFWVVLAIMAGSITLQFLADAAHLPESPIFFRLINFCLLLIIISWIWAVLSVNGFILTRQIRGNRQQLGQILEERFEIVNQYRFIRPWLEISDQSPLPGPGGSKILSWIGSKESRNYSAYTLLSKRGEFELGPTVLISGDPFGLFSCAQRLPGLNKFLVLPYIVDIKHFPYPPGFLPGGKTQRQRTLEVTPHAASVREYAPGDPLSRIHWPSTAKRNQMMVKEFEQDPSADVWVFLDGEKSTHCYQKDDSLNQIADQFWLNQLSLLRSKRSGFVLPSDTFEYAVSIAASIAKYFVKNEQKIGLTCHGQRLLLINAERGDRQLSKIMEVLALIRPEGRLPIKAVIESQSPNIPRGSTVILITSANQPQTVIAVESLIFRDLKPVVVYIDASSFNMIESGYSIMSHLAQLHVPFVEIKKDDDLKTKLEIGFREH